MSASPATESPLQYLEDAILQLKRDGLYRTLRELDGEQLPRARFVRVLISISPRDVRFTKARAACGRSLNPSHTYRAHRKGSSQDFGNRYSN